MARSMLCRSHFLASVLQSLEIFYAFSFPCGLEASMAFGNLNTFNDVQTHEKNELVYGPQNAQSIEDPRDLKYLPMEATFKELQLQFLHLDLKEKRCQTQVSAIEAFFRCRGL